MSIIKRITSAGLSLAMAATIIPSSFAVSTKSASTLSSVTAKYLDAENGKEIAKKQTYSVTHEEKSPQTITNYTYMDYTESVEYVYSHKDLTYIIGYPDKGVHPNGDLTRAEAAMIFYRLYDGDYPSFTRRMSNSTFKDVSAKNWFYELSKRCITSACWKASPRTLRTERADQPCRVRCAGGSFPEPQIHQRQGFL